MSSICVVDCRLFGAAWLGRDGLPLELRAAAEFVLELGLEVADFGEGVNGALFGRIMFDRFAELAAALA
jgi:hypothetical protein